jgi:hypothetical protein
MRRVEEDALIREQINREHAAAAWNEPANLLPNFLFHSRIVGAHRLGRRPGRQTAMTSSATY